MRPEKRRTWNVRASLPWVLQARIRLALAANNLDFGPAPPCRGIDMIKPCLPHLARVGTALLALTGSALLAADYPTTILSHYPVAYWRFSETAPPSPALNLVT